MSDKLVERIKKDMEKHGFPLEIRISHILQNNGWNVTSRYSFLDKETKKTREVDCLAVKGVLWDYIPAKLDTKEDLRYFAENNFNGLRLIVECKRSSKPWVFYTTKYDNLSSFFTKFLGDNPMKMPAKSEQDKLSNLNFVKSLHQYSIKTGLATNYFEPFTKGEGNQIFDATMKVVKALSYDRNKMKSFCDTWKISPYYLAYYPVIVFEGNLYQCTVEKEEENFSRISYLQLNCDYLGETYRIDVVSSHFFPEFLKHLDTELEYLRKLCKGKRQPTAT